MQLEIRLLGVLMTDKKRPGSMSDDDRALAHRRITPSSGVVVGEFEQDFTPVQNIIDIIEERIVLTERERLIVTLFWRHTANIELRARSRSDSQDTTRLRKDIDALELAIVDIRGEHGNNGKVGALKARVDQAESRRWQVVMFLAGLLVTVVTTAVYLGLWMGRVETDVDTLKQRARRSNTFQPADPADRTTP